MPLYAEPSGACTSSADTTVAGSPGRPGTITRVAPGSAAGDPGDRAPGGGEPRDGAPAEAGAGPAGAPAPVGAAPGPETLTATAAAATATSASGPTTRNLRAQCIHSR